MENLYIGLMSGTSLDGIDAALVEITDTATRMHGSHYQAYDEKTRQWLHQLSTPTSSGADFLRELGQADAWLGQRFAETVIELLENEHLAASSITAIGSHGQTIAHAPDGKYGFTMQIGDPHRIACQTGITTIADFRRMDIAHGGQGAPLVPLFHRAVFGKSGISRAIVNIGGIANISLLPSDTSKPALGFDTGPGNTLMNAWIQQHLHQSYDQHGGWASQGQIHPILIKRFMEDPYISLPPPKSTGTDYFSLPWLEEKIGALAIDACDVQATLCAFTALSIQRAIETCLPDAGIITLCGGGARNLELLRQLHLHFPNRLDLSDQHGIDAEWVEACAFAWLARQRMHGIMLNTPPVTGASQPCLLGAIYQSKPSRSIISN